MLERVIVQGYGAGTVTEEFSDDQVKVKLDAFDAWLVCPLELCASEVSDA